MLRRLTGGESNLQVRGADMFTLSPQRVSAQDLGLWHFLGLLMGVCIRTRAQLAIHLPALVWK